MGLRYISHNLLFQGYFVFVSKSFIGLTMSKRRECSDQHAMKLSKADKSVTLKIGMNLYLDTKYSDYYRK